MSKKKIISRIKSETKWYCCGLFPVSSQAPHSYFAHSPPVESGRKVEG